MSSHQTSTTRGELNKKWESAIHTKAHLLYIGATQAVVSLNFTCSGFRQAVLSTPSIQRILLPVHYSFKSLKYQIVKNTIQGGTSLAVWWLRFHASYARDAGSIPGQETKIPHAIRHSQKKSLIWQRLTGHHRNEKLTLLEEGSFNPPFFFLKKCIYFSLLIPASLTMSKHFPTYNDVRVSIT